MGPGQGGGGSGSGGHLREKKFCFYVHFLRPLHMDTFDRRPSLFFLSSSSSSSTLSSSSILARH